MAENTLHIVDQSGLSVTELLAWFESNVGEVAFVCGTPDAMMVELMLENETEIASHKFGVAFPTATARLATPAEYATVRQADRRDVASLCLTLGRGGDGKEHAYDEQDGGEQSEDHTLAVKLRLCRDVGYGTGSKLWPGGLLLAEWLLSMGAGFLTGRDVLELGAGAAALPATVAAVVCGAGRVKATDCVASVLMQMQHNLTVNAPSVETELLDWRQAGRKMLSREQQFDLIFWSDGIYTDRGALFLADAITSLLRPGGLAVGALPDTRTGIKAFERDMCGRYAVCRSIAVHPAIMARVKDCICATQGFIVAEELEGYRLLLWREGGEGAEGSDGGEWGGASTGGAL